MTKRSAIPLKVKRLVEIEAGHRCAIPTCKKFPIDVHHIIPYEKCKNHSFENLIVLCTECHARYHRTKEIDIAALKMYKTNLGLLNIRYSKFERRVLQYFLDNPNQTEIQLWGRELDLLFLIRDGLLKPLDRKYANAINFSPKDYSLTPDGRNLIDSWRKNDCLK